MTFAEKTIIAQTYRWLQHSSFGVTEVRAISSDRSILIGYFDNEAAFVDACVAMNDNANVYAGIQPRPRPANDLNVMRRRGATTKATDISVLVGTVIDIDPVRAPGTASTDEELASCMEVAEKALFWCDKTGIRRPLRMMSGNGVQLWFAFPPTTLTQDNRLQLQVGLRAFESELRTLGNARVKIDSIHDFPRIIKVIGTLSRKGEPSQDRPHRVSYAIDPFERVDDPALLEYLLGVKVSEHAAPQVSESKRRAPAEAKTRGSRRTLPVTSGPIPSRSCEPGLHDVTNPDRLRAMKPPVPMCGPFLRLWERGLTDRSLAIFLMVRYLVSHGLSFETLLPWIIEYDRRVLGKLNDRTATEDIQRCYDKIREAEKFRVSAPCHALAEVGYCGAETDPSFRCDLREDFSDLPRAMLRVSPELDRVALRYRLFPIVQQIAKTSERDGKREHLFQLLETRFKLDATELNSLKSVTVDLLNVVSPGSPRDRFIGKINAGEAHYFVNEERFSGVISSFVLKPKMRVLTDDGDVLIADARTIDGQEFNNIKLPMDAFRSRRDLQQHLKHHELTWTGKDVHVQGLLNEITRCQFPTKRGVAMLGRHMHEGSPVWVHREGAIDRNGAMDDPSIIHFQPQPSSFASRFAFSIASPEQIREIAAVFFEHILELNEPKVVLPMLGWFAAAPTKPVVMEHTRAFPLLFVWGTAGSGKSSALTEIFWPFSGLHENQTGESTYSCNDTEFAMIRLLGTTNAMSVVIDEYKPEQMPGHRVSQLHRLMRSLYRGESESRGQRNLSVKTFELHAPVVIAGESLPREQALIERAIIVNTNKSVLEQNARYREAFHVLKKLPLHQLAGRYAQFTLGRDAAVDLDWAGRILATSLEKLPALPIPERVRMNLTIMVYGLYLMEEFAHELGMQLPLDKYLDAAVAGVLGEILETDGSRVEDALDRFLKTLAVMSVHGEIQARTHYAVKDNLLHIHLESCHDAWLRHLREINHKGEVNDLRAMRKIINENHARGGYVVNSGNAIYFRPGHDRRRAVSIDLSVTSVVTAEEFPMNRAE